MARKSIIYIIGAIALIWFSLATLWGYPLYYYSIIYHKYFPEYRHKQVTIDMQYKGEPNTIQFVARCRQMPRPLSQMRLNYHQFLNKNRLNEMFSRWRNGYPTQTFAHIDNPTTYTKNETLLLAYIVPFRSIICSQRSDNVPRLNFGLVAYPDPNDVKGWEVFPSITCGEVRNSDTKCFSARIENVSAITYGKKDTFKKQRPAAYPRPDKKVTFWNKQIVVINMDGINPDALAPVEEKRGVFRLVPNKIFRSPKRNHFRLENDNGTCKIGLQYKPIRESTVAVREDLMCTIKARDELFKPGDLTEREWFYLPGEPKRIARFAHGGRYPILAWRPIHRETGYLLFGFLLHYLDTD